MQNTHHQPQSWWFRLFFTIERWQPGSSPALAKLCARLCQYRGRNQGEVSTWRGSMKEGNRKFWKHSQSMFFLIGKPGNGHTWSAIHDYPLTRAEVEVWLLEGNMEQHVRKLANGNLTDMRVVVVNVVGWEARPPQNLPYEELKRQMNSHGAVIPGDSFRHLQFSRGVQIEGWSSYAYFRVAPAQSEGYHRVTTTGTP